MRILFISRNLMAADLVRSLKAEGHSVKLCITNKNRRRNFEGIVEKTNDWKSELVWVGKGKNSLIVFDDVGFGKEQDELRSQGYSVFGGSELGDKLEMDREYGQEIFRTYGIKTVPLKDFNTVKEAEEYIKNHPAAWVVKQNNNHSKKISFVGERKDGKDVLSYLKSNLENAHLKDERITLHKRIFGVEIGAGRYFNGTDWVGPIEINLEHTRLFPNDIGPITDEMGTLAWYTENEKNKLWQATTAKLKPYLQEIGFRGDIEINAIVNKQGAFALEATARFGCPIIHLHKELHVSPWGEFLKAIADGKQYKLKYKRGYGIVTALMAPPFPYYTEDETELLFGTQIFFDRMSKKDWDAVHFDEVARAADGSYYIADNQGYVLYVTSHHRSLRKAQDKILKLIKKISFPKMMYREDIGGRFLREDKETLKRLGYIKQDWHDKYVGKI